MRRALQERGWKQADLAKAVGCAPSVISELLKGAKHQSPYVPAIHAALGWTPPQPPLASPDTEEILDLWNRLDDKSRQRVIGFALGIAGERGPRSDRKR